MIKKLIDALLQGSNSGTIRLVTMFGGIWVALSQSQWWTDLMNENPDWMAVVAGIQSLILILQRYRTTEPVKAKPTKPSLFVKKK
jgi:hypothetical protein